MLLDAIMVVLESLQGLLHGAHSLLDDLGFLLSGTPFQEFLGLIEFEAHLSKGLYDIIDLIPDFYTTVDSVCKVADTSIKLIVYVIPLLLVILIKDNNFLFKLFHEKFSLQSFNIHSTSCI